MPNNLSQFEINPSGDGSFQVHSLAEVGLLGIVLSFPPFLEGL